MTQQDIIEMAAFHHQIYLETIDHMEAQRVTCEGFITFMQHMARSYERLQAARRVARFEDEAEQEIEGEREDVDYEAFLERADAEYDEWRLERRNGRAS